MINKKNINKIVIGIILLIAIVIAIIFWIQNKKQNIVSNSQWIVIQTPIVQKKEQLQQIKSVDETLNWQTYTNIELGFEIKYPKNWLIEEHFNKSEEFSDPNINNKYLKFKKNDAFASFTFGIGNIVKDYLGQPRGIGAVDEHIQIGTVSLSNTTLYKYYDYYKNDNTSADIWYFASPNSDKNSTNSGIKINDYDIFIEAMIGLNINDLSKSNGKKYNKTTVTNDPDLLEIDKILSTFKFTK